MFYSLSRKDKFLPMISAKAVQMFIHNVTSVGSGQIIDCKHKCYNNFRQLIHYYSASFGGRCTYTSPKNLRSMNKALYLSWYRTLPVQ